MTRKETERESGKLQNTMWKNEMRVVFKLGVYMWQSASKAGQNGRSGRLTTQMSLETRLRAQRKRDRTDQLAQREGRSVQRGICES